MKSGYYTSDGIYHGEIFHRAFVHARKNNLTIHCYHDPIPTHRIRLEVDTNIRAMTDITNATRQTYIAKNPGVSISTSNAY